MSTEYPFPFVIRELTNDERKIIFWDTQKSQLKFIGSRATGFEPIRELGKVLYNFKARPEDIWLIGFPRSGTTFTQEILYLIGNDLNYEKAASEIMDVRFPMLHTSLTRNYADDIIYKNVTSKEKLVIPTHVYLEQTREKRFIKSHYGFNLLHPEILASGCKMIFMARNIKDVMVSYFRYPLFANIPNFEFKHIWKCFKHDLARYGNYYEMLEEAWKNRHHKNLLILFYEEANMNKPAYVRKIADFLGKQLSESELQTLLDHVDIENFRKNESVNGNHLVDVGLFVKNENFSFIRQGKCGGWKQIIPEELIPEIDEWIMKNFKAIPEFEIPDFWLEIMDLKE